MKSLGHRERLNRFLKVTKDSAGNLEVRNLLTDQLMCYHSVGSNSLRCVEQNAYMKQTRQKYEADETDAGDSKYGSSVFAADETELADPNDSVLDFVPPEEIAAREALDGIGVSCKGSIETLLDGLGMHIKKGRFC